MRSCDPHPLPLGEGTQCCREKTEAKSEKEDYQELRKRFRKGWTWGKVLDYERH